MIGQEEVDTFNIPWRDALHVHFIGCFIFSQPIYFFVYERLVREINVLLDLAVSSYMSSTKIYC